MYDRHSREKIGRIDSQFQQILAGAKKEGRGLNNAEREKWERLMDDRADVERELHKNEQGPAGGSGFGAEISMGGGLEEMRDRFRLSPKAQRERLDGPHGQAFSNYLRKGLGAMEEDQRQLVVAGAVNGAGFQNAQGTTPGTAGGYTVAQSFSRMLEEALKYFGGILGNVDEFETENGAPMPYPTVNDTGNEGRIIGQNVQVTETDLVFGQTTFNAYIFSSDVVLVPLALMQDSYFDLDALLARLLGIRIGRLLNAKCTIGSGTGEPSGIVTGAVTSGNVVTFPGGETASVAYNDLINVQHAVDPAYRYNPSSKWMFNDSLLKLLKKLVDGNSRPLWQPGLTASFETGGAALGVGKPTILGAEYSINPDMAVPAANAYSVMFGDLSKYKLRKIVNGISVLRLVERYADYLQVGFLGWMRADGQLLDAGTHPISLGQQSAS